MEKELVEFVVKSLVDAPDEVSVNVIEGEKSTILELKVAQEDVGKVIGKQGRIAKAIRTIFSDRKHQCLGTFNCIFHNSYPFTITENYHSI